MGPTAPIASKYARCARRTAGLTDVTYRKEWRGDEHLEFRGEHESVWNSVGPPHDCSAIQASSGHSGQRFDSDFDQRGRNQYLRLASSKRVHRNLLRLG